MNWIDNMGANPAAAAIAPAVRAALAAHAAVCFAPNPELNESAFEQMCDRSQLCGVFSGDQNGADLQSVYDDIRGYAANKDEVDVFGVSGLGCFCIASDKISADAMRQALTSGEVYNAPQSAGIERRLSGKVAIVTGSAQGFGDGIAREMVAQGAYMVIADLNEQQAAQNAQDINAQFGAGTAIHVKVDVSDEASVQAMIEKTVLEYGGLDILVSNAGVLKAGGLEEMTVQNFEFVTKINYTAFFICTKYAARPMRIAHTFDKTRMSDIVQINSKSGLEGSNKNFAYAGGKFGGIGLVQSFAKELVTDGIKVNAICPGNFYEGPLWSDPERGLFVQYLNAGKVPGAKTVEDVKQSYISKVPMLRGCYPKDVARAIFYCMEQEYETGQAIPVTGGQNMLN